MDLRRLGHVVALADECHFARAAERVHLSQPAFSRSIQAIEDELGIRLFERGAANIRPTPAGEFVIEKARRLLFDARCVQRDIEFYRNAQLGDTAFGVGPFPAVTLLPSVLSELRREHPSIALRVIESNWKQLLERLRKEEIEFFLADTTELPDDGTLEIRLQGEHRVLFYVRAGHPLASRPCTVADAWRFGVASVKSPDPMKARLAAMLGLPAGQTPTLALECDNLEILKAVALATDTVLSATNALVRAELDAGRLVPLTVTDAASMQTNMGIVSLRNRTPSPMAQLVIAAIERFARTLDRAPSGAE
ncbi:LysR family transcriptional regulator [Burkholderia guangdongensis]|uniref:LysR family transcriptional regulator n=1 Tax=Burkholderia guangdongensis TaxID=1792500 RepID=UPI0015CC70C5|nr:LysR family transcriptional regulator [Burkholderia guangdongensis]